MLNMALENVICATQNYIYLTFTANFIVEFHVLSLFLVALNANKSYKERVSILHLSPIFTTIFLGSTIKHLFSLK